MRRNRSFYKKRKDKTPIIVGAVIFAVVLLLVSILGFIVYSDNDKICKNIGLTGSVFSECHGEKEYDYSKVTLVVGNTANSPEPELLPEMKKYLGPMLLTEHPELEIFSVVPGVKRIRVDIDDIYHGDSLDKQIDSINSFYKDLNDNTLKIEPESDGASYLEAISKAARSMNATEKEPGVILVMGSGLSDSGLLDFSDTNNDILHSEKDILDELVKDGKEAIVKNSLKNITIVWFGIGEVVNPQKELQDVEIERLKTIYKDIFKYMGADEIRMNNKGSTSLKSIETKHTVKSVEPQIWSWGNVYDSESSISFISDSARLKDEVAARRELQRIIDEMRNEGHPNASITIEGYVAVARCGDSADTKLSEERANIVKELFVSMGVNSSRLSASGKGKGLNDECKDGVWVEEEAAKNRIVMIYAKEI